ncbi:putative transmembrane protein [Erysiphe neolycopersici]|uniref:Putative transmembrane protein n=1 Tax=Erysiphe neolycopersici TaxID=212602 RepID=A0A420I0R6_9PEZI|nr:putative transmembrane protein [Erysiphe neolycopersici]
MVDDYTSSSSKHLMSHFQPNAILRGAQLTIVGALRALRNPSLLTSQHYKQVAIAIACGITIRIAIALPVLGIKFLLWLLSFLFEFEYITWSQNVANGLGFIQNSVLQIPLFLMMMMRNITPTLDDV